MTAPVCPVSRSQPVSNQIGLQLPPPVRATDLPSVIAAIEQIKNNLGALTGAKAPPNNLPGGAGPAGGIGVGGGNGGPVFGGDKTTWTQRSFETDLRRVTDPDDKDNWVEFRVVTSVSWDNQLGHVLTWAL